MYTLLWILSLTRSGPYHWEWNKSLYEWLYLAMQACYVLPGVDHHYQDRTSSYEWPSLTQPCKYYQEWRVDPVSVNGPLQGVVDVGEFEGGLHGGVQSSHHLS